MMPGCMAMALGMQFHTRLALVGCRFLSSASRSGVSVIESMKKPVIGPPQSLNEALERIQQQQPDVYCKLLVHNFPFTVQKSDVIVTHRIRDVKAGDVLCLDRVREVGSEDFKLHGRPILPNGLVSSTAVVLEHSEGLKRRCRMRKQRKGHVKMKTIQPSITKLQIRDIQIHV